MSLEGSLWVIRGAGEVLKLGTRQRGMCLVAINSLYLAWGRPMGKGVRGLLGGVRLPTNFIMGVLVVAARKRKRDGCISCDSC